MRGFTLIELAVVIAIVGLLLGGLLIPLATHVDAKRVSSTQDSLDEIKQAIYGYAVSSNPMPGAHYPQITSRLPCPDCMESTDDHCNVLPADDIGDGEEDYYAYPGEGFTGCATYEGNVPWVSLGVGQFDSWNRNFRYRVTDDFADAVADQNCGSVRVSIGLCTQGDLDVQESVGEGSHKIAEDMAAVILSLGEEASKTLCSQAADPSPDQEENVDCNNSIFVSSTRVEQAGNEFDDVVIWVSPSIIKLKLLEANILP
jgi:prepilin-type N-terminal cleavage/methylation domain-containing protein